MIGHRATDGYEPRQVRKEAAISKPVCVVDRSRLCDNLFSAAIRRRVHNQIFSKPFPSPCFSSYFFLQMHFLTFPVCVLFFG